MELDDANGGDKHDGRTSAGDSVDAPAAAQRRRVLSIVALASAPLIALVLFGIWQGQQLVEARVAEERIALAQAAAITARSFVSGNLSTGSSLAQVRALTLPGAEADLAARAERVLAANPDWEGWGLAGPDGWNIVSTGAPPGTLFVGDRPYFQDAIRTGKPVVSPAVLNRRTGRPTIVLAVPVDFDDGARGALIISLRTERVATELATLHQDPSIRLSLIDAEGTLFIDPDPALAAGLPSLRGQPAINAALAGSAGSSIVGHGSDESIIAYAPVTDFGWGVLVTQPTEMAFDVPRRQTVLGIVTLTLAIAAAGAIGWHLGGRLAELYRRQQLATARAEATARTLATVSAESERRRRFFEGIIASAPVAIAVLRGCEYRHEAVNGRYQALKPDTPMLGRTVAEVFPQTAEQGAITLFDRVRTGGEQIVLVDQPWHLHVDDGQPITRYFTHVVAPLDDEAGEPDAILSMVLETTDTVLARQRSEREKDEFLSTASHELKTPLTSLSLAAQMVSRMLERGSLDETRLARHVRTIQDQVDRASSLIGDLLDVSRIEAGQLTLARGPVDLAALARAVVERQRDVLAEDGHHELSLRIERPDATIRGDEARLEQVLQNLLSNAIKYSPGGGTVEVVVAGLGDAVRVDVVDRGIGVPAEERDRLFEPFSRTPLAITSGVEGTGLGLYISRRIVEAHGGTIEMLETPGGGATFRVTLPVAGRPGKPDAESAGAGPLAAGREPIADATDAA